MDNLERLFSHIHQGFKASQVAQDLEGRMLGLTWGLVVDTNDPLKLGRVKVTMGHQGGNSASDWLVRVLPWKFLSVPYPAIGDTVLVGFPDGNANQPGYYVGWATNLMNPPEQTGLSWTYLWDSVSLIVNQEGILVQLGDAKLLLKFDDYIELGWGLSFIKLYKDKIQLVSPNISMGTTKDSLTDIATWNSASVNFTSGVVKVHNKDVCVLGGEDDDGDNFVVSGQ